MSGNGFLLSNERLRIALDSDKPIVTGYSHIPSGQTFTGGTAEGCLCIDEEPIPWSHWSTTAEQNGGSVIYRMRLQERNLLIGWRFSLNDATLTMVLDEVDDPDNVLHDIGWHDLPLLVCDSEGYSYWRMFTGPPEPEVGHKMWSKDALGAFTELEPEPGPVPVIYGAVWNNEVCAFVDSNYPLFPITHQNRSDGTYAISLNTYQYRVRNRKMPPLEVTIGFLSDTNGDGRADVSDYRLWINRSRPSGDQLYFDTVTYKIFMDLAQVGAGVCTDLEKSEEIIRSLYNISDGLPQIVYLVGHQAGGHDARYPTLAGGVNPNLGTDEQLRRLFQACKEKYNTILSYHTNLDDAYRRSADWDDRYVIPSGSPGPDGVGIYGSVCHTTDVETGGIFRRLEELLDSFPLEKTLHVDNLRLTNTVNRAGWENIGILEELVCGLIPVMDWLKERGITATTEGYNGMPIDPACLVSGFWHHDAPDGMRQLLHRRISGGGRGSHFGDYTVRDYGICNNFHIDIAGRRWPPEGLPKNIWNEYFAWLEEQGIENLTWNLEDNWKQIVDCLYLGALLHHFYNEREMLIWDDVGRGHRLTFEGGVVAEICIDCEESLKVTMGDVVIADGNDRFIPRDGAIYAYSGDGSCKTWKLPDDFKGASLEVYTLPREGRAPAPEHVLSRDTIELVLDAGAPVKLMKA